MTLDDNRKMPVNQNHFLDLKDLSGSALRKILTQAAEMKSHREDGYKPLSGKKHHATSHTDTMGSRPEEEASTLSRILRPFFVVI